MRGFFAAHPEAERAVQLIKAKPFSTGFDNASYNSLNAFRFVNAGRSVDAGAVVDGCRRSPRARAGYAER